MSKDEYVSIMYQNGKLHKNYINIKEKNIYILYLLPIPGKYSENILTSCCAVVACFNLACAVLSALR